MGSINIYSTSPDVGYPCFKLFYLAVVTPFGQGWLGAVSRQVPGDVAAVEAPLVCRGERVVLKRVLRSLVAAELGLEKPARPLPGLTLRPLAVVRVMFRVVTLRVWVLGLALALACPLALAPPVSVRMSSSPSPVRPRSSTRSTRRPPASA